MPLAFLVNCKDTLEFAINHSLTLFSTIDVWKTKIDATHNYWSYNETISVGSRIRDKSGKWIPLLLYIELCE